MLSLSASLRGLARLALSVVVCSGALHAVQAQTTPTILFDEVHTIAAPTSGVPVEHDFTITAAGDYNVTLTDLGAQLNPAAPLQSVEFAVTSNDAIVGAPQTIAGTLVLHGAQPGTYQVHVVGTPGTTTGSGPIGIQVVSTAGGAPVASFSDTLALPPGTSANGPVVVDGSFTVPNSGSYQVTLTDLKFPSSLPAGNLTLALVPEGGASLLVTLPDPNTHAMQATVQLSTGVNYRIFAAGQADSTVDAGLYSATVAPAAGGTPVYQATQPLGTVTQLGTTPTLSAATYTVTLTDLLTPTALALPPEAVLVQNGTAAVMMTAAGSQTFSATAGSYEVFALATAPQPVMQGTTTTPGAGSYALQIGSAGAAPSFSVARPVVAAGVSLSAYSFDANVATAGTYVVRLADFLFPSPLTSVTLVAAQNGAVLGSPLTSAGSLDITASAGTVSLLVFAQASSTGTGGLFGTDIAASSGGDPIFETTQGVGKLFTMRQVDITTAGNYQVTATDLGFPQAFNVLAVVVTHGTSSIGSIFAGTKPQSIPLTAAAAGTYFINFIATPAPAISATSTPPGLDSAGTYAVTVAFAPAITLTANPTHVTSGGTVTLTWSSQNTTSCTASNGWTGTQALSGTAQSAALTAATTFTLSCTGSGGTTSQSVNVTIDSSGTGGGGGGGGGGHGGGSIDAFVVLVLVAVILLRVLGPRLGLARQGASLAIAVVVFGSFCVSSRADAEVQAATSDVPAAISSKITSTLKARFPDLEVGGLHRAPVAGLFEVVTADNIVYVDESADFVFVGRLIDTRTKEDLSRKQWNQYNIIDFKILPLELAIKTVKGDGSRVLALFEDPHCPFCKELEQQMDKVTNVTLYTFLFPLEQIHPGATDTADRIWCSQDAAVAWSSWMLQGTAPAQRPAPCDAAALAKIQQLAAQLRINSTPTLFYADGDRSSGVLSADQLESALNRTAKRLADKGAPASTTGVVKMH